MFYANEGKITALRMSKGKNFHIRENFTLFTYSRDALTSILTFLEIDEKNEVILPDFLCSTVIEAVTSFSTKIKFYKINEQLLFNSSEIKKIVTDDTKIILFVDYFGVQAEIEKNLEDFLVSRKIIILKDAAHSFLSQIEQKFEKKYHYDFLITSIYKNIPIQVGALAVGELEQQKDFISGIVFGRRILILAIKNILCLLGLAYFVNVNADKIKISARSFKNRRPLFNISQLFRAILTNIDFKKVIEHRKNTTHLFHDFFRQNKDITIVYNQERIGKDILQVYPILVEDKNYRDFILKTLRYQNIDAFTWPVFHKLNYDERLWSKLLLIPLDPSVVKVLNKKI